MYQHYLRYLALGGWLLCAGPATAQTSPIPRRSLSLTEAVTGAIEQSKALKINAATQNMAEARLQLARNQYAPTITANFSYIRISDNIRPFSVNLPGAGDVVLNPQILDQSYNSMQVRQLLWGGGKVRNGILAGQREVEATLLDATQYRIEAADQVTAIWHNLYLFNASETIIRQNITLLQERRRDLANLEKQGIVLKNDVLKIDLAISNLESSLIDIESGRAINQFNMAMALNYPTETRFDIDSTELALSPDETTLPDLLAEANRNRPELQALNLRRESALLGDRIVRSNRLPTISWGGSYDYNRPNIRVFPNRPEFTGTWNVGVFLSVDIAGLYTNRAKETESRYGIERLSASIGQVRDEIQIDVNAAYQRYRQARDKIRVAEQAIVQAAENFRVEQNKLKATTTNPTDFLEANTQLLQGQLNLRSAKASAALAQWKLRKSIGQLTLQK